MKTSYVCDQDPRYGWVSISMEDKNVGLIIVDDRHGKSYGFTFTDGEMVPTCICSARSSSECACLNVGWEYWM
jgi:hypothetical protein